MGGDPEQDRERQDDPDAIDRSHSQRSAGQDRHSPGDPAPNDRPAGAAFQQYGIYQEVKEDPAGY